MNIENLAIWVHPLWSSKDLGQNLVDEWKRNIYSFAEDEEYAFILVGCPRDSNHNQQWHERVIPLINELPGLFDSRYIRWHNNFVESNNPEHIKIMEDMLSIPKIIFHEHGFPLVQPFEKVRVDGLIRQGDYCVKHQMRNIRLLTDSVTYWDLRL